MRILIYTLNSLFGQCVSHGLSSQSGIDFAGYSNDPDDIVILAQRNQVTSVLVDQAYATEATALKNLVCALPSICVLALAVDDQQASVVIECARLGCHGIVPRDAKLEDVIQIIQAAENGEVNLRPEVCARMMQAMASENGRVRQSLPECLTRREKEICSMVCEGLTNKEIAREVNLSVGTVKNHVRSILSKLDLSRRGAIHTCLYQHGMLRV